LRECIVLPAHVITHRNAAESQPEVSIIEDHRPSEITPKSTKKYLSFHKSATAGAIKAALSAAGMQMPRFSEVQIVLDANAVSLFRSDSDSRWQTRLIASLFAAFEIENRKVTWVAPTHNFTGILRDIAKKKRKNE